MKQAVPDVVNHRVLLRRLRRRENVERQKFKNTKIQGRNRKIENRNRKMESFRMQKIHRSKRGI